MTEFSRASIEVIPEWLAATRDLEIAMGLSREEALLRARKLRHLIREDKVSPKDVELDEDGKDVLYALVKLVEESNVAPQKSVGEAAAVYKFLRRIEWPVDCFDEKNGLLRQCAIAGWRSAGIDPLDVGRRCRSLKEGRGVSPMFRGAASIGTGLEPFFAKCRALYEILHFSPMEAFRQAAQLYASLEHSDPGEGLFDEWDQALGEAAVVAASAARVVGQRSQSLVWCSRAESWFRNSVGGGPGIAYVNFSRAAILFEEGRHEEASAAAAYLQKEFESFRVDGEAAKCRLLQAMAFKCRGRLQEAFDILEPVALGSGAPSDAYLRGRFLCELADIAQLRNDLVLSASLFGEAEALLKGLGPSSARADLASFIGGAFARIGNLEGAIASLRQAIADSIEVGLRTRVAYLHVVHADLLLAADRSKEAEAEILAAMPTIDEQAMVPEGLAALTLLKESMYRRNMDPNALRELRERLHWKRWE